MLSIHSLISSIPLMLLYFNINADGTVSSMRMKTSTCLSALLVVAWSNMLKGVEGNRKEEVEQHLQMGQQMLRAGQLADALSHYHAAIDGDPTNYMAYYRRATVYLALGKSKSALPDLDKVIKLKPDFTAARVQRASVRLKQGNLDDAKADYEEVLNKDPSHAEAKEQLDLIDPTNQNIEYGKQLYELEKYEEAIDMLTRVIEVSPWNPDMRELRAECYIAQGDYFKAIGDIRPTTKLRADNTAGFYKLSQLNYQMGDAEESLLEIRECLKLDPDHKECFPHYKKVKKLVKQIQSVHNFINEQKWEDCVSKVHQMQQTEPKVFQFVHKANSHLCHCHSKAANIKEAFDACNTVLESDENDIEALCDRAETYIANEQFEEAIADYKAAQEVNGDLRQVQDGLKRAEKLLKQSNKRDYYKILGLKRNAKKAEIKKAYKELAVQWHPDKYSGDDEKKHAEKMFIDIAAAKEVLTDPDLRAKFDNGEDPLDAEEQSGRGGGHPFGQGFNPFGQGGYNFKFHFN